MKDFFKNCNSSSDSDSDPEGGELPDIPYHPQEPLQKKKLKKKRMDKMIVEEQPLKSSRRREVRSLPKASDLLLNN